MAPPRSDSTAHDFWALAERFLHFAQRESGCPVIICNDRGTIVKATVKARVGTQHAGAERILRGEVAEAAVTAEEAAANPLIKEGHNCPILVDGKAVGTFGIAGPLEVVRPVARMAALVLAVWLSDLGRQRALQEGTGTLFADLDGLAARTEGAGREAVEQARAVKGAAQLAAARLDETGQLVTSVVLLARQSRILAINASVEATRLGEQGRAFSVVAKEMLSLAEDAGGAAATVQKVLSEIHEAVRGVGQSAERTARVSGDQLEAVSQMAHAIDGLRAAVQALVAQFGDATISQLER